MPYGRGRFVADMCNYGRVLEVDPAHGRAQNNLALRSQGRVDEAADHFRDAVRIDPRHAPAR